MHPVYYFCHRTARLLAEVIYEYRVIHPERLIEDGPALICANHASFFDPPLVAIAFRNEIHYLARSSLYNNPIARWLFPRLNVVPVDQERAGFGGLKSVIRLLEDGKRVLIFPEGSRSPDGQLQESQPGAGLVVARTGAPVVPIRLFGSAEALPVGAGMPRLSTVTAVVGEPLRFPPVGRSAGKDEDPEDQQRNHAGHQRADLPGGPTHRPGRAGAADRRIDCRLSTGSFMLLSIVIPAFNEEKLLAGTLQQLQAAVAEGLTPHDIAVETIVCDNNSTDATAAIAAAAGARVVFEPVNQIGRARNTGAQAASGDWILFVDADSRPEGELLADLAEALRDSTCLGGGCLLRMEGLPVIPRLMLAFWHTVSRWRGYPAGSFLFVRTEAFRACGGFDESLFAAEEVDLAKRLRKFGRPEGRRMVILTRHRMLTSARKLALYSPREHLAFFRRLLTSRGRALRSRGSCHLWYDGRR